MFMNADHPDAMFATVTLDGFKVTCIAADTKAGWIECYDWNKFNANTQDKSPTYKCYGKVRIHIKKPMNPNDPRAQIPMMNGKLYTRPVMKRVVED